MNFDFERTKWFRKKQPAFAGEYEAELSDGQNTRVKFNESGWDLRSATVVRWRGQKVRLTSAQREFLLRTIHDGRYASLKHDAQEAALWLARSYVVRAASDALPHMKSNQAKRNACGWYQIARRLGVDMTSNVGAAWEADKQALAEFWSNLPTEAQERITRIADGFKDGSGDRVTFE